MKRRQSCDVFYNITTTYLFTNYTTEKDAKIKEKQNIYTEKVSISVVS